MQSEAIGLAFLKIYEARIKLKLGEAKFLYSVNVTAVEWFD